MSFPSLVCKWKRGGGDCHTWQPNSSRVCVWFALTLFNAVTQQPLLRLAVASLCSKFYPPLPTFNPNLIISVPPINLPLQPSWRDAISATTTTLRWRGLVWPVATPRLSSIWITLSAKAENSTLWGAFCIHLKGGLFNLFVFKSLVNFEEIWFVDRGK